MELLADIVQNSSLEDSQIEKERDVILREMQENDASMQNVVFDYLHATAFQGTPLAQAVEGPSENVRWEHIPISHSYFMLSSCLCRLFS